MKTRARHQNPNNEFVFTTSNYDAMKKFLTDFCFQVAEDEEPGWFGRCTFGRTTRVTRGNLSFYLEEANESWNLGNQRASFSLALNDYSSAEIKKIESLGYTSDQNFTVFGENTYHTPDGGLFVICR